MTTRNIAIGIDPTQSTAGARVIKRDLDDIAQGVQKVENQTGRARDALGRFAGGAGAANDNLRRMNESAKTVSGTLGNLSRMAVTIGASLAAIVGGAVIAGLIKYADTAKNLTSQLRLVTASSEELVKVQEQLFKLAQGSRSSYESTVTLYARLSRAADSLGLSQGALLKITDTINKAFIVSGATATESYNATIQLAQGLASGALRGDEFNSVAEQAPRLLKAVADYLKMDAGQLRALAAEGKITAGVLAGALFASADKINSEFQKMEVTVGGATQVLRNSLLKAIGELDAKLGISSTIANGIIAIASGIDALSTNMDKLYKITQVASILLTAMFAESILAGIARMITLVGTGLVGAFSALNAVILANPVVALTTALVAAGAAVYYFRDEIKQAIGVDVWGIIKDTANLVIGSFAAAFEDIKFLWNSFPDIIEAAFTGAINQVIKGMNTVNDKMADGINWLREKVGMRPLDKAGVTMNELDNPAADRLGVMTEERNKKIREALQRDYLADVGKWWEGGTSVPGVPPANDNATLPPGLGSGQSADQLKKYNEIIQKGRQAIQLQEAERRGIGLTAEAARTLRIEQELLNKAANDNIQLTPKQTSELKSLAREMSAAETQTQKLQETFDFSKDTFEGFFADIRGGLKEGATLFEAFSSAVINALNRIADRLLDKVFESIFLGGDSGSTSGGGGVWGIISKFLGGGSSTPAKSTVAAAVGAAATTFAAPVIPVTRAPLGAAGDLSAYAKAIQAIESKGSGGYSALGPITRNGDRAYGAYQIMGNNIGPWSKEALGRSISSQEFMNNPGLQDQIFNNKFGGYVNKYGPSGAAQAWFGGPGSVGKGGGAMDILGTSGTSYVNKFNNELSKLGKVTDNVTQNLSGFGQGLGNVSNSMANFFPAAPSPIAGGGGGGGGLFSWIGKLFNPAAKYASLSGGLFDTGGYTGPGGRKDIAGLVHAGEVVFNQDDVSRHGGYGNVEAMRRGVKFGGSSGAAAAASSPAAPSMSIGDVYVTVPEGTDTKDADMIGKTMRSEFIKIIDERMTDQQRVNGILDRGAF